MTNIYEPVVDAWNKYSTDWSLYKQWKIDNLKNYYNGKPVIIGSDFAHYKLDDLVESETGCTMNLCIHPQTKCILFEGEKITLTKENKYILNYRLPDLFMGLLLIDSNNNPSTANISVEIIGIKNKYNTILCKNIPTTVFNGTFFPVLPYAKIINSNKKYENYPLNSFNTSFTLNSDEPITIVPIYGLLADDLRKKSAINSHVFPDYINMAFINNDLDNDFASSEFKVNEVLNDEEIINVPIINLPKEIALIKKNEWLSNL